MKTYVSKLLVSIDAVAKVQLPPRVFRGLLKGFLFETDKCFLLPGALGAIKEVKLFYDDHPGLEVMVSGHADRAGGEDYNLGLSVERAEAVEAFLQDQVERWMPWYGVAKPAGKRWGTREDQHMLSSLKDGDGKVFYGGPIHGRSDPATKDAVNRFRVAQGLPAGPADTTMREALVREYMATDDTTLPAGTPISHHGCGEYHPVALGRDGASEDENRRVEVFLFDGPVDPPAPAGGCPRGGCTQYPEWKRRVVETIDVNVRPEVTFVLVDEIGLPYRNAAIKVTYPTGRVRQTSTDEEGTFVARLAGDESLEIELQDAHEAAPGDGIKTPSGKHFTTGGSS